jgi:hypothetical protein
MIKAYPNPEFRMKKVLTFQNIFFMRTPQKKKITKHNALITIEKTAVNNQNCNSLSII